MKKTLLFTAICLFSLLTFESHAQTSLTVFDEILFYDGYAAVVDFPTPEGVIRHRNDLYAKKLTSDQLASFGSSLTINVTIKAACDNYDRIGNVNLAMVPAGSTTYDPSAVQRLELGRFITPFMNKNIAPDEVPYTFSVDNIAKIFKDPAILAAYDIWVELEVFGVPYAANTQVAGCAGRNDVFFGTLEFVSNNNTLTADNNFLLPMNFKKNLNNYQAEATDAIGTTVRTINFNTPTTISNSKFYIITSSHGANAGGEEYNRRNHRIYYDGTLKLLYKPGVVSCEPYRQYNTQGNGIYGPTPRPDSEWASFSNWCPGQVIPIREVPIDEITPGDHTFKITVNTAVFNNGEGYIPVSVYLQGNGSSLGIKDFEIFEYSIAPNPTENILKIHASSDVKSYELYNFIGQEVIKGSGDLMDLSNFNSGMYIAKITFENGKTVTEKIIRK